MKISVILCTLVCILLATPALAQVARGNLLGRVVDSDGATLPGVTITLGCDCDACKNPEKCECCPDEHSTRVAVSDSQGRFRFISVAAGKYFVEADLQGFSTVKYRNVSVTVDSSTTIEIQMKPSADVDTQ